ARDLGGDHRLHRTQAVERAEVEIAAVDERTERLEEPSSGLDVARDRTRLLPGVALPVPALLLEVGLQRGKADRDPAGIAERAQAQVDAVAETVAGALVEQARELLA